MTEKAGRPAKNRTVGKYAVFMKQRITDEYRIALSSSLGDYYFHAPSRGGAIIRGGAFNI